MTRTSSPVLGLALGLLLGAGLVGCGSSAGDQTGETSDGASKPSTGDSSPAASPSATAPEDLTVAHAPFCADVDHASADQVLGVSGQPTTFSKKPGDKIKTPAGESEVTSYTCVLSYGQSRERVSYEMTVSGGPSTLEELRQRNAQLPKGAQGNVTCTTDDDDRLGDGFRYGCTITKTGGFTVGYPSTTYYGLAGDALLTCGVHGKAALQPALVEQGAEALCTTFLEQVSN